MDFDSQTKCFSFLQFLVFDTLFTNTDIQTGPFTQKSLFRTQKSQLLSQKISRNNFLTYREKSNEDLKMGEGKN